jgi:hypothetical protein
MPKNELYWGQTMKKALQSNDLPTEFAKWREMAADRNHRPPPDKTSGLSLDTAMYPHEYKTYTKTPDEQTK